MGPLFDWYDNGDMEGTFGDQERVFRATADFLRSMTSNAAAIVLGRQLFDLTKGWQDRPSAPSTPSW